MKVRWTTGSIRFRITPGELTALTAGEPVSIALAVPGGSWIAAIRPGAARTEIALAGGTLTLSLTDGDRNRLAAPAAEGVYFKTGDGLRHFVEKDFPCVHPGAPEAEEAPSQTFAPPAGFAARHQSVCAAAHE